MEINLRDNIYYKSFDDRTELKKMILEMIYESKTDKILYKGDPNEINYKLMKKVMVSHNAKIDPSEVRNMFREVQEKTNNDPLCLIFKK